MPSAISLDSFPHHRHRHRHRHRQCIHPFTPFSACHVTLTPAPIPTTPLSLRRSQLAWTNSISQNVKDGECRVALQTWKQMQAAGVKANSYTFVAVLRACGLLGDLETGREVHTLAIQNGLELQIFVAEALLGMYANCGSMEDACLVFGRMPHPDVVSWDVMIRGYTRKGEGELALGFYEQMQKKGFEPDARTFVSALKACSCLAEQEDEGMGSDGNSLKPWVLKKGRILHSQVARRGLHQNPFVATGLVDMYAKCGSMEEACLVFQKMPHPDVVSWTALILGYAKKGEGELALKLFEQTEQKGLIPDALSFVAALKACSSLAAEEEDKEFDGKLLKLRSLKKGRRIHSQVVKRRLHLDRLVATSLVDMYAKCGSIEDAYLVFERMPNPDVVSWNAIILGYAERGEGELALELYEQMELEGFVPDALTFVGALKACTCLAAHEEYLESKGEPLQPWPLTKGRGIHRQISSIGLHLNTFVATSLLDMYAKCGSMDNAHLVFKEMVHTNVASWNAMILGYAQSGEGELALQLYEQMQQKGFAPDARSFIGVLKACICLATEEESKEVHGKLLKVNSLKKARTIHSQASKYGFDLEIYVANTLVNLYAKCGSMQDACWVFDTMPNRDVVTWTAIILGHVENEQGELALQFYARFCREGFTPDAPIFLALLKVCGTVAALKSGKKLHSEICKVGLETDPILATCLINMYAKCGCMYDAQHVFDKLLTRDIMAWTALILGYSRRGESERIFSLFDKMLQDGVQPDGMVFLSLLTVCSHVGMVDQACEYFHSMSADYGISPTIEHYSIIIDLLGRAGRLDEAEEMVKEMPFHVSQKSLDV